MKKSLSFILVTLTFILSVINVQAQAPDGVNYQAVVRDIITGLPLNGQTVDVRFTIHQTSPTGPTIFTETHTSILTNQFGLINLELGSVDNVNFSGINWGTGGPHYLQIEVDAGGGFDNLGASQLLSVPFALFARSAATGAQGFNSLIDTASATGAQCPTGGYVINSGLDANANTILDVGEITSSFPVCNGTTGVANNSDTSATNEIQTISINATNDTIFLSNGGFVILPSVSGGAALIDGDGDTQVLVDSNNTDDDVIHFINAGIENVRIKEGRVEFVNNSNSVFIGLNAGSSTTTASGNTFVGDLSGQNNTTGLFNTALGGNSLSDVTGGHVNTALGFRALDQLVSGSNNVAVGLALPSLTIGGNNIAIGQQAGDNLSSGSTNIFIGAHSGSNNINGDGNIFIGDSVGYNETGAYKLYIGSGSTSTPLIWGDFALDLLQFNGTVNINNAYTLPNADGTISGQVLTTNAAGNVTWQMPAVGLDADADGWPSTMDLDDSNNLITFYDNDNDSTNEIQQLTLVGDSLALSLGGGSVTIPDADPNNERITTFSVNGTNDSLVIVESGVGHAMPLSDLSDTDWAIATGSVYNTNDSIGIGTTSPLARLNLDNGGMLANWSNTGGIDANITILNTNGASPGYQTGTLGAVSIVASPSAENKYAVQGIAGGDSGNKYGLRGMATGLGSNYGIDASASGGTLNNAVNAFAVAAGTSQAMGLYSTVQGSTSGNTYGVYGQNASTTTGLAYAGYFQNLNNTGTPYGLRSDVSSSSGGNQYGVYTGMNTVAAGATKYGFYANVSGGTNNWAAYFASGDVYIQDNLVMPTGAGAGLVLTSDGAGNATWQTSTGDGNGLYTGSGSLSAATTVTQAANVLTFNSTAAAGFNIDNDVSGNLVFTIENITDGSPSYTAGSIGARIGVSAGGAQTVTGVESKVTGTTSNNKIGGWFSAEGTGSGWNRGAYVSAQNSTGSNLGIDVNANSNTGTNYGMRVNIGGTGTGTKYGLRIITSGSALGTKYGIYTQNEDYNYFNGDVGVGTASPAARLDVMGNVKITDGTEGAGKILVSDASGTAQWKTNQVAFDARIIGGAIVALAPFAGNSPVNFDASAFNFGNNFDPSIGANHFRPTVSGVYSLEATILIDYSSGGPNEQIEMAFVHNSSLPVAKKSVIMINPGEQKTISLKATMHLNAGETVHVEIISQFGAPVNIVAAEAAWFSGHIVYED